MRPNTLVNKQDVVESICSVKQSIEVQMTLSLSTEPSCAWSVPTVLNQHIDEIPCTR